MKLFISLKVPRGDAKLEALADTVANAVLTAGHEPFVATREIARQGFTNPKDFMPFVRQQAATCGLMIVLYHPELRGGLIEMGLAYAHQIPIWLCYKRGQYVSSSARGCADLTVEYVGLQDLEKHLTAKLREFSRSKNNFV